jgi:Icc-related predicted phosphoesterase
LRAPPFRVAGPRILVAHTPPLGLRDVTLNGEHAGSKALLGALRHKHPRLVICGHLHEGHGATRIGHWRDGTVVANVSALGWDYQVAYPRPMGFVIPPAGEPVEVRSR